MELLSREPDRHGLRGTPRTVERGEATESGTDRRFQKKLGTGPGWASHGRGVAEVVVVVWVVLAWRWDTAVAGGYSAEQRLWTGLRARAKSYIFL